MVFIRIPTFFWKSTAKKLRALQNCSLMPRLSETWSKLDANAETLSLYRQTDRRGGNINTLQHGRQLQRGHRAAACHVAVC